MATKFVTNENLARFKENLDGQFVQAEEGKVLSSNDFDNAAKEKLEGLENYVLPTASAEVAGGVKIGAGLAINAETGVLSVTGGGVADAVDWENVTSKPTILTTDDVTSATTAAIAAANLVSASELEDYATTEALEEIEAKLAGVYHFQGSVDTVELLPEDAEIGDVYNVIETGMNYAKTEDGYDALGTIIDLTDYVKQNDLAVMSNAEIDALFGIIPEEDETV